MHTLTTYRNEVMRFYRKRRAEGHRASQALIIAKHDAKYDPKAKSRKLNVLPCRYQAYEEEQINDLPNGWKWKVEFRYDSDSGPPEKVCDGHGETSWTSGCLEEWEKDWVLRWDGYSKLVYDYKGAIATAMREGWDSPPYRTGSRLEQAQRAIKSDFDYLHGYYNDDWCYVGMIVTLLDENDEELNQDSCWGFESNNIDYLCSEARSWASHMIRKERKERRQQALTERIANRFTDAMECGI